MPKKPNLKKFNLKLYVSGATPACIEATSNIREICEEYLKNNYVLEIIDVRHNPDAAAKDQIIAIPTLIRSSPQPESRIIGALNSKNRVLIGLGIHDYGKTY